MATERVVAETVDRAIRTAVVEDECRFDPAALAAVIELCSSGRGRDAVDAAVDRALQRCIDELDRDGTLAATALRRRIAAATTSRQIVVENIQGDVGTGRGAAR